MGTETISDASVLAQSCQSMHWRRWAGVCLCSSLVIHLHRTKKTHYPVTYSAATLKNDVGVAEIVDWYTIQAAIADACTYADPTSLCVRRCY
jgi:hypothetical protein